MNVLFSFSIVYYLFVCLYCVVVFKVYFVCVLCNEFSFYFIQELIVEMTCPLCLAKIKTLDSLIKYEVVNSISHFDMTTNQKVINLRRKKIHKYKFNIRLH